MSPVLHRPSLVVEARNALREAIMSGQWRDTLPGELELCRLLRISRVTLRAALGELEREGLIQGGQGKRRRICLSRAAPAVSSGRKTILMLSPRPLHRLSPTTLLWVDALRKDLAEAGLELDVTASAALYTGAPERRLARWLRAFDPAGVLLYRTTPEMQSWFAACGRPSVIAGSRHAGVALPAVDLDYAATCHHAVGRFLSHGHRNLALLLPRTNLAGDMESQRGFREALARAGKPDITGQVLFHDGSKSGVVRVLKAVQSQSPSPTGYLVAHATHVLTAVGYLMSQGRRLGREVALISRDDDPFLEHLVPSVARYSIDSALFARQFSRLVIEAISGGRIPCRDHRLMPRFVPGETLA